MLWQCDSCFKVIECDPCSHSDWGGVIEVQGPDCQECDQPMDPIRGRLAGDVIVEDE